MSVSSRLRQFFAALGVGYLGLAAWNGRVYRRTRNLEFPLPLEGESNTYDWPGGRIYYTRRGRGEPVLLVHGIYAGADSNEFQGILAPLAGQYEVYAYDLLGFGHSAHPDLRYSGALYVQQMLDFVRNVIRRPTTVFASSLSGGHAVIAASQEPNLIRRLILEAPTGGTMNAHGAGAQATYLALNLLPELGEATRNLIASRRSIRWYLRNMAFYDPQKVTDELVDYLYRSAHQPGGEHALVAFLTGHLDVLMEGALRSLSQPISLFWGRHAQVTPLNEARHFLVVQPKARLHALEQAGLDALREQPQEIARQTLDILAGREPAGERAAEAVLQQA